MNKKRLLYLTNLYIKKKEEKIKRKEHNIFQLINLGKENLNKFFA